MKYQVAVKMKNGKLAYLEHRGKTEWSLRTAKKHSLDVQKMIIQGKRPEYWFSAVVAS